MPGSIGGSVSFTRWVAALGVAACLCIAVVIAVHQGSLYDDEISNVRLVEGRDIASIIHIANSTDVHPPGSYVLNALALRLLGSWESVKIAGGCLNAIALAIFLFMAYGSLTQGQRLLLTGLLATASTTLLWGASIRWYSYFNPVFTVALALLLFSSLGRTARSLILGVAAILLFYLSYAAICAGVILLLVHVARDYREWQRTELFGLTCIGAVALAVCLPQLQVFLHVHMANQGHQVGGPITALIQTGTTLVVGNAVFPAAPLPILYAVVVGATCLFWLFARSKVPVQRLVVAALITGVLLMVVLGIGVKPRNSVFLLPLVALILCWAFTALPPRAAAAAIAVLIAFQALGLRDLVFHVDTLKGSYNSDFRAAMRQVAQWHSVCGSVTVFNHDPVLTYMVDVAGLRQSSPYETTARPQITLSPGECVVLARTFHGVIALPTAEAMYGLVTPGKLPLLESSDIGPDRYFAMKGRLMHDQVPPFYLHLDLFRADRDITLTGWSMLATSEGDTR